MGMVGVAMAIKGNKPSTLTLKNTNTMRRSPCQEQKSREAKEVQVHPPQVVAEMFGCLDKRKTAKAMAPTKFHHRHHNCHDWLFLPWMTFHTTIKVCQTEEPVPKEQDGSYLIHQEHIPPVLRLIPPSKKRKLSIPHIKLTLQNQLTYTMFDGCNKPPGLTSTPLVQSPCPCPRIKALRDPPALEQCQTMKQG